MPQGRRMFNPKKMMAIIIVVAALVSVCFIFTRSTKSAAAASKYELITAEHVKSMVGDLRPGETGWTSDLTILGLDENRYPKIRWSGWVNLVRKPGDLIAVRFVDGKYYADCYAKDVVWREGSMPSISGGIYQPVTLTFHDPSELPGAEKTANKK